MTVQGLQAKDKQFYSTIVASNGRVLYTSETYQRRFHMEKTAKKTAKLLRCKYEFKS